MADRCALAIDNARLHTEARRARDDLEAIVEGVADAVTAQSADGRLIYANDAAVRLLGFSDAQELLSADPLEVRGRYEMLAEDGSELPVERLPGRRALLGERPPPLTVRYRHQGGAEDRWSRVQSTPVFDERGAVRLAINVIEDITEIKRAELGQRFLAEASHALNASLDHHQTLRDVARLAVPTVADWCAVDLVAGDDLERVAVEHVDPARVTMARELQERYPPDPDAVTGVYAVVRFGRAELYREVSDELLVRVARDEEHLALLRTVGLRSAMLAPMMLRDRVLGVITFASAESGRRYDELDLSLAQDLALRAAAAVENARLYETAATIAGTLQASLLPPTLPELPGAELAAVYRPAGRGLEVGGDFYDVFSVTEDQWYLVVGDVCGKGAEAAAVTALARYTIRAAAVRRRAPSAILRWLSDAMLRQSDAPNRFCTIACAQLDLGQGTPRVTVACGGHPLPLVVRADGTTEEIGTPGTLLGLVPEPAPRGPLRRAAARRHAAALHRRPHRGGRAGARVVTGRARRRRPRGRARGPVEATVERLVDAAVGSLPALRDDVAVLALRPDGTHAHDEP